MLRDVDTVDDAEAVALERSGHRVRARVAVAMSEQSFSHLFSRALQGHACSVVGVGDDAEPLPVHVWTRAVDHSDAYLLDHCTGATIDVGCGPGRLTEGLAERGHVVLGIDVVHEAVRQTRQRGVSALVRDVFDAVPGEGRWQSALLADGNVGIGGDPVALLARLRAGARPAGSRGRRGRRPRSAAALGVGRAGVRRHPEPAVPLGRRGSRRHRRPRRWPPGSTRPSATTTRVAGARC